MNRESQGQSRGEEPRGSAVPPTSRGGWAAPGDFLREVRAELKKVAWPTRQEVINYSIVVLVVSIVLTLFVAGIDWILRQATLNFFG